MIPEAVSRIAQHLVHARQYFDNAGEAFQKKEASKTGELLWGSIAESLHALAAYRSILINSHVQLRTFYRTLASELGDPQLLKDIQIAESLHRNFYAVDMDIVDVETMIQPVREAMVKILSLIPLDVLKQIESSLSAGFPSGRQ